MMDERGIATLKSALTVDRLEMVAYKLYLSDTNDCVYDNLVDRHRSDYLATTTGTRNFTLPIGGI